MKKGKNTEALAITLEANKAVSVAGRLQTHVDNITGLLTMIAENWLKLGEELLQIRNEGDFAGTFEEFVKDTFNKTRGWAYQFIQGYEARLSLPESEHHVIQNPRQALALAAAPLEKRAKIIAEVKDSGKPVTAKAITEETAKQKAQDAPVFELDDLGNKIPPEILPEWNRAKDEVREARSRISAVSLWFRDGLGDGKTKKRDPIFRAVAASNAKLFTDIKRQIAMVDPYAVCPTCKGSTRVDDKKCKHCIGTGFISKFEYEHAGQDAKKTKEPKVKEPKVPKESKTSIRFAKFIHAAHGNDPISISWNSDTERGSCELKDGTLLAFEEKDGEFKLVETQD
jgi:hypothetical protein